MTFSEILAVEDANTDRIYLYREGLFLKAYERSAFLCHRHVHAFKLSRRFRHPRSRSRMLGHMAETFADEADPYRLRAMLGSYAGQLRSVLPRCIRSRRASRDGRPVREASDSQGRGAGGRSSG